jgi:hypothetical protein
MCDFNYISQFSEWVTKMGQSKVLVLTNRDIMVYPHVYGEDYYIHELMELLKKSGIGVGIAVFSNKGPKWYSGEKAKAIQNMEDLVKNYVVLLLHGVSPLKILRLKFKYNLKLVMPVFFLWNRASSAVFNLKGLVGNTFWQLIISCYIATSPRIVRGLRLRGVLRRIYFLPPMYKCKYCDPVQNAKKLKNLKKRLPLKVKVTYIGSLNNKRFPLVSVVKKLQNYRVGSYELAIYTTSQVREEAYTISNVKVDVKRKILSDKEKCKVLQESHLFIAPKPQTTMDPSISVMEATYHGDIVIRI